MDLREDDFSSAENRAWEELEAEVVNAEMQTSEGKEIIASQEEIVSEEYIDEKLSKYYGVDQINDAVVFVTLYPRAQSVQIAGDFNNWQPQDTQMQKVGESGVWQKELKLPSGRYRYRLVVDGQWQQDPYNDITEMNPFGEYNSIFEVK